MFTWSNHEVEEAARETEPEVGFLNHTGVVVALKLTAKLVAGVHGKVKEEMVGDTLPTTVNAEQVTPPEQEAEEVATEATVVPLPPP